MKKLLYLAIMSLSVFAVSATKWAYSQRQCKKYCQRNGSNNFYWNDTNGGAGGKCYCGN